MRGVLRDITDTQRRVLVNSALLWLCLSLRNGSHYQGGATAKIKQAAHSQEFDKCGLPSTIGAYDTDPTASEVPSLEPPQRYVNNTNAPHLDNVNAQLTL